MPPHLERIGPEIFDKALDLAEKSSTTRRAAIRDAGALYVEVVEKAYRRMQQIDARLRSGNVCPPCQSLLTAWGVPVALVLALGHVVRELARGNQAAAS